MVTEDEIESIKADILLDLLKRGIIGKKHTSEDNIIKSFPKSQRGIVKTVRDDLKKKNILMCKPTGYGKEFSINPKAITKIMDMPKIKDNVKKDIFLEQRIKRYLR